MAGGTARGQRHQTAVTHMRQRGGDGDEHHVHLPGNHIRHAQRATPVGNMGHMDARFLFELLHAELQRRAVAGRCVVVAAGLGACGSDEVLQGLEAGLGVGHEQEVRLAQRSHGHQVALDVIGQALAQGRQDGDGAVRPHQQGVAIGRRLGHHIGRHDTTRPRAVFHHHGLFPGVGQAGAEVTRQHVGRAACRVGHQQVHGFGRVGLRMGAQHTGGAGQQHGEGSEERHTAHGGAHSRTGAGFSVPSTQRGTTY